jgi:outer membrane protein, heavy metal efflux system
MNPRIVVSVVIATLLNSVSTPAQTTGAAAAAGGFSRRFVDSANGLSLDQAIARALEREPSLRAARSEIDTARGMRLHASLRPNPSMSFERREQPDGADNQTTLTIEWPLDLFRRSGRLAVAEREIASVELAVANRERLLAADVRMRYGEVLVAVRDVTLFDQLVAVAERQRDLLRSRVDEGASPPLERDLVEVELRRLQADRTLQAGRAETALFELKRVLGMTPDATLTLRETLEALVERESTVAPPVLDTPGAIGQRADVREAAARVGLADARIERARGQGRVDLGLFANYMRMDAGFPQRGFAPDGSVAPIRGIFHYVSAGVAVTLPLFNRNQGEVAAAKAERTGAMAAHDAARLAAEAELAAARARDDRARQAVALYRDGVHALAQQNLGVISQSFELGRVTVFNVLAEQRRYLDIERAYTDALRAAYDARTALNRARGELR